MSKEADKEALEPAAAQRRRRKSALRIPSDNVPRSGPLATASPDGVPDGAGDGELEPLPSDGEVITPIAEDPHVSIAMRSLYGGEYDETPRDQASGPWRAQPDHTSNGDLESRPTVQMPAITEEMLAISADSAESEQGGGGASLDTSKTREMPAIRLEELGLIDDALAGSGNEGDELPEDIPIDVDDDTPAESRLPPPRASTMALSDDDLEEFVEPGDLHGRPGARPAASRSAHLSGMAASTRRTLPLSIIDDAVEVVSSDDEPQEREAPPGEVHRSRPVPRPEPGVPAAVAALEGAGMESPLDTPLEIGGEPGDNDEIISDDLIEEVDDSDMEVEPSGRRPSPPPAPPSATPAKKPPPSPSTKPRALNASAADAGKPRRKGKPWFEEIFDEDYLRTLPFLTPQATQSEAAFVASALEVDPGSQLLDLGCGYGRHAMELAARGYQVVALDLSLPLLLRGADEAQRRGLNINFVHGDMRELSFEAQFDGAYCLFSTFGYFDDETNKKTAQAIARALKPGARLVIEVLNRDYLIADLPARVWWEGDGCVVLEEVDFNYFSSRITSNRSVVFDDGRQLEQEISLRAYSLHEFGKLLHASGFRVVEVSGSMATRGRFFGNRSRGIIVIAEKRVLMEPGQGRSGISDDSLL